jgi:hypothetical protein
MEGSVVYQELSAVNQRCTELQELLGQMQELVAQRDFEIESLKKRHQIEKELMNVQVTLMHENVEPRQPNQNLVVAVEAQKDCLLQVAQEIASINKEVKNHVQRRRDSESRAAQNKRVQPNRSSRHATAK